MTSEISVPFDAQNPDMWLEELLRRTSALPELARRGSVHVLRALLTENDFVNSAGRLPGGARLEEWSAWHVARGRVNDSELGKPGVLLVHEALAGAAEDEEFVAVTLKARAWKDSGYDPEGLFKACASMDGDDVDKPKA